MTDIQSFKTKSREAPEFYIGRHSSQSNLKLKSETSITQATGKAVTFKEVSAIEQQRIELLRE